MTHYYPTEDAPAQGEAPDAYIATRCLLPVIKYAFSGALRRFVRTVRNGRVRIHGYDFVPNSPHVEYDGRFEGHRYVFMATPKIRHSDRIWYDPWIRMRYSARMGRVSPCGHGIRGASDKLMYGDNGEMLWEWWEVTESGTHR